MRALPDRAAVRRPAGGRHVACGHVDPGTYFADEFAKWYLTGRIPMGARRSRVVSAPHMSYRTPESDPYEPKDSNPNPMASQVVVGCSRWRLMFCRRKSAWGRRRQDIVSHVSMHYVFEEISDW
eukprot:7507501-Pyramimonas_sp.AAC.1